MLTIASALQQANQQLQNHSPSPRADAQALLSAVLRKDRAFLFTWPEHELTHSQEAQFLEWLERRVSGETVAYLVGYREFYGHRFMVSAHTLIPRPDTEVLVETALAKLDQQQPLRVADLGTGTGAIAISLALACPQWQLLGCDLSREILDLAERNAFSLKASNAQFLQSSWLSAIEGALDAVVSNPPYIEEGDAHLQQGDVRFEPDSALVSGPDGLDDIRIICAQAMQQLKAGGLIMLEHGYQQAQPVADILHKAGFEQIECRQDLAGHDRISLAIKPMNE